MTASCHLFALIYICNLAIKSRLTILVTNASIVLRVKMVYDATWCGAPRNRALSAGAIPDRHNKGLDIFPRILLCNL